jgi:hypothetical protein
MKGFSVKTSIVRMVLISTAINLFLAPLLGTTIIGVFYYKNPFFAIAADPAGVPVYLYALISYFIPILIASSLGNYIFKLLCTVQHRFSRLQWNALGFLLGSVAGAGILTLFINIVSEDHIPNINNVAMVLTGTFTGAICGFILASIWWQKREEV